MSLCHRVACVCYVVACVAACGMDCGGIDGLQVSADASIDERIVSLSAYVVCGKPLGQMVIGKFEGGEKRESTHQVPRARA